VRAENGVLRKRAEASAEAAAAEKRLAAENAAQRDALQKVSSASCHMHMPKHSICTATRTVTCICTDFMCHAAQLPGCIADRAHFVTTVQQDLQRLAAEAVAAADRRRADGDTAATADSALADLRGRL
jgi:hypothetical protein